MKKIQFLCFIFSRDFSHKSFNDDIAVSNENTPIPLQNRGIINYLSRDLNNHRVCLFHRPVL